MVIYMDTLPRYIVKVHLGGVIFLHGTAEFLDRARRRHRKVEEGMVAKNRN